MFSASLSGASPVNVLRGLPPPLNNPGSRQRKSPLRGTLSLFLSAFGSGVILHPCRSRPLGASLRLAPAYRKRFGDFQPDQGAAVTVLLSCNYFIALKTRKLTGILHPYEERARAGEINCSCQWRGSFLGGSHLPEDRISFFIDISFWPYHFRCRV